MFASLSTVLLLTVFGVAAATIGIFGTQLTRIADALADRTGLGEALAGGLLLGAATSLPGIVTSVTAAAGGHAELAVSNAVGGIAAQTAFLAIGDITYRRANLEHAAASVANLLQGALLVTLLAVPLLAVAGPAWTVLGVHPATAVLLAGYLAGVRTASSARREPMWESTETDETVQDEPEEANVEADLGGLWLRFALFGLVLAVAGWVVARSGVLLAERTGLSETVVGALLTAVATSLPELVTTLAAVRRGALSLAVGGVIGGNVFDVLFLAFSDVAYRDGSIYHAAGERQVFLIALTIVMTGVLLLGFLRREKYGFANIGFESTLILLAWVVGSALLFF